MGNLVICNGSVGPGGGAPGPVYPSVEFEGVAADGALSKNDRVIAKILTSWANAAKKDNPEGLPATITSKVATYQYSSSNDHDYYVAFGVSVAPYLMIYVVRSDGQYSAVSSINAPPGPVTSIAFGPGTSAQPIYDITLAVTHDTAPYVTVYGGYTNVWLNRATPDVAYTSGSTGVSISPDGYTMAVGITSVPFFATYDISGNMPIKKPNSATALAAKGLSTAFTPDGKYIVGGADSSMNPIRVFDITSGTPTWVSGTPDVQPAGAVGSIAFSPDGKYMAAGTYNATNKIITYSVSGSMLTKTADPDIKITTSGSPSVAFSGDSALLGVGYASSPYATLYSMDTGSPVKLNDMSGISAAVGSIAFTKSNQYMVLGGTPAQIYTQGVSEQTITPYANLNALADTINEGGVYGVGFARNDIANGALGVADLFVV